MSNYVSTKVRKLKEDTTATLRTVDTPHVPKQDKQTFEKSLETSGTLTERQRASHLMGLLYGARMAHPGLSTAIGRLAPCITKWNAECERRLHRMFAYLKSAPDLVLCGCLGEQDLHDAYIQFSPDADLNGDEFHTKSTSPVLD